MELVLASASPRRKELLEMLGFADFKILPARGEEIAPPGAGPEELVMALSAQKAREVSAHCAKEALILAADTIVWADGQVLGKPKSEEDAVRMLRMLSGREHQVYTGVTLLRNGEERSRAEESRVFFRELSQEEILAYVATGEPMDKAGAYGAQGKAALFVRKIEGDFFNVMGLPLCCLGEMLKEQGVVIL